MRALIQRVKQSDVSADGKVVAGIGKGILIFLGVTHSDTERTAVQLAGKCSDLRIFEDGEKKMNLSVKNINGEVLVISQFTLYADTRRGNRPSFTEAAEPGTAEKVYKAFIAALADEIGKERVKTGVFRAMMDVRLVNDGPVTIMIENKI